MNQTLTRQPAFPPGRYGRRRGTTRRRWPTYLIAALVAVAGFAVSAKLYFQYARAPYQATLTGIGEPAEHGITVTFTVRKPAGRAATCAVRARNRGGAQVGSAQVPVPAGTAEQTSATITYTIVTTERPVTGEVLRCGPAD